jgi:hypothetical protein
MTGGEQFVQDLPKKRRFYDRHERRLYELTKAVAIRLVDNPDLARQGLSYLKRYAHPDPQPGRHYVIWDDLLRGDVRELVRRLLEDSPEGALLRETQPVFCVLSPEQRAAAIIRARQDDATLAVEGIRR